MTGIKFISTTTGVTTNLNSSAGFIWGTRLDGLESAPLIDEDAVELPYRDGGHLIASRYRSRVITYEGTLSRSTAAELRTSLDLLKANVSGDGYLDVQFDGETAERRYNVHVTNFAVASAHYLLTWVPFTVVFTASQPFGRDKTTTATIYSNAAVTANFSVTHTILGTADADVTVTVADMPQGIGTVEIINQTTGDAIQVTNDWKGLDGGGASYNVLQFNSATQSVMIDGAPTYYSGNILRFPPGPNQILVNFLPPDEDAFDLASTGYNKEYVVPYASSGQAIGQMFPVSTSYTLSRLDVLLRMRGSMPSGLVWTVYKQAYEGFSGTPEDLVEAATGSIPMSALTKAFTWVRIALPSLAVSPTDNNYYLQLQSVGQPDPDNAVLWKATTEDNPVVSESQIIENYNFAARPGEMTFKVWKSQTLLGVSANVTITYKRRWL